LHLAAGLFGRGRHTKRIFAKDFADVSFGVLQQNLQTAVTEPAPGFSELAQPHPQALVRTPPPLIPTRRTMEFHQPAGAPEKIGNVIDASRWSSAEHASQTLRYGRL
jgi:hypothetical protein